MRSFFLFSVLLLTACHHNTDNIIPANPNASAEAKNLLAFISSLKGRYTLAGQHNFVSSGTKYDDIVYQITGKEPVIWGCDFSFMADAERAEKVHHCGPMNMSDPMDSIVFSDKTADQLRQELTEEAKRQYARGKIITLMWHCCFPTSEDSCRGDEIWAFDRRPGAETIDSLTMDGTALNLAWKKQVDRVAHYLKQLQEARIPVLWRPYHEMNGVWFWWCNLKENQGFIKLWKMMYNYFTYHHKLTNLLWVWDANAPRDIKGDEAYPYDWFYPGNDYVDILAADVYHRDYKQSHHDALVRLGKDKPIALGEIGEVPVDSVWTRQNKWTWFMVWGYFVNQYNKPEEIKSLYNNPRILTLDRISRDKNGVYSLRIENY